MATSALNPNAPIFVPSAYRAVEDFSDQWWDLVQSSPWFRDYWLHECFSDPQIDSPFYDFTFEDERNDYAVNDSEAKEQERNMDLVALGWRKPRGTAEMPRYCEKPPKIVNVRARPRLIQQPR